tara:strand:+ start:89070 stop:89477 length:408 start_codon:yes stop_codon:yes gene_type:complete
MTISLKEVKQSFADRQWKNKDNKRLLNIVSKDKLNIEPACIYGLDQRGLSHLEIITLSGCIGKVFDKLPPADIDFLNLIQDHYGLVFNLDEKINYAEEKRKTHPMRTKLKGYAWGKSGDNYLGGSALLQLGDHYE